MERKFVILNMGKIFGNLEFAGEDKVIQRRINGQFSLTLEKNESNWKIVK
ncbi:Bacterial protein of uncharacterised function (DUF961) [Streptococcus massiliensis]|uniref:Bacterial protein of uncharacterized function (DUF961) n=1 Tax=Streptococcus massiliensis TaxID=313439 RepID=A0A380L1G1_9STRE|nr:hypothetical protein [Streptococcus massiliensis]SUN77201.1 Bacterial protein of uncharacterised function (DUF961) [Streptococcus massiliensis]